MNSTAIRRIAMALAIIVTAGTSMAEEGQSEPSKKSSESTAFLYRIFRPSDRKRMPSKELLELVYADGNLTLESSISSGCYTLTLDNEETGAIVTIPTISVGESVSIDLDCGQYTVTATGSEGQSYEGFMELM